MLITVHFRKVDISLHIAIKANSVTSRKTIGYLYSEAMKNMIRSTPPITQDLDNYIQSDISTRVGGINSTTYKLFKSYCARRRITAGTGINEALKRYLDNITQTKDGK